MDNAASGCCPSLENWWTGLVAWLGFESSVHRNWSDMKLTKLYQLLNERKHVGIVYHFTSFEALPRILQQDLIWGKDRLSTTRDKLFHIDPRRKIGSDMSIRIALDGDKMSDVYKSEPINAGHSMPGSDWGDEAEEMWSGDRFGDGIRPASKYIKEIVFTKKFFEKDKYQVIKTLISYPNVFRVFKRIESMNLYQIIDKIILPGLRRKYPHFKFSVDKYN